ncbi:MAG: tetratricopeptide repeat protein [Sphingobacteriales bacterium]|nr:tetratricopeptide repeat protein [Sphingobacteriales bacterium]
MKSFCLFSVYALLFFCMQAQAQDFDDLNDQAFRERDNKNFQKAIDLCNQALNKKINARSYIIRADSYYEIDKYELAIEDFNSSLTYYYDYYGSDDKEKGGIYYFRGRCKQKLDRYNDAITDFNSALSYNYKEPGYVYWNRGACYYELRDYQKADDDYAKAIDRISEKNDLSTLWTDRGDCQANLGKYEKAWDYYAKGIQYDPNNYSPYWQRGHFKGQQYKYEDALSDFTKAINIINAGGTGATPNDLALLYRNKALMHKNLAQYEEALESINKSIESDPNIARAYRTRAEVYAKLKKYDKAKADYESAIILQTDKKIKADMYIDRSVMFKGLLDYKSCLMDINKAIEQNPESGLGFWHRSLLYGYKKNYPLAIKDCSTALELYKSDSSNTASLLWLRAGHKTNAGDYNGAINDYREYTKYYPESYSVYYEIGRIYKVKLKNNDLANANLSRAARLAWDAQDTSKYCYIKVISGDKEEPFKLQTELIVNAQNDDYQYKWELHNMACMYSLAGNAVKGLEYQEKSFAAGYDDFLHLVNDRDLELLMKQPKWKLMLAKYKVPVIKN